MEAEADASVPLLEIFSAFNTRATHLGKPIIAFSPFYTALSRVAALTGVVGLGGDTPPVVTKQRLKSKLPADHAKCGKVALSSVSAEFRLRCEQLQDQGLGIIAPDSRDHLAVMMKYVNRALRTVPEGTVTGDAAYKSYSIWSRMLGAKPMVETTFKSDLLNLIATFGSEAIHVHRLPEGDHLYSGLTL